MERKQSVCLVVTGALIAPYIGGMADGKAPNSNLATMAKITITALTSTPSAIAADGSIHLTNAVTGKDVLAFAPAIRKAATKQST